MLVIEDLVVAVGSREIVQGVTLYVSRGEVHVIIGPNGSGKSTLLHAIAGDPRYRIVRGRILFEGQDITYLDSTERVRKGISIMCQIPPTIRQISTRDLVEALERKFGRSDIAEKAREILEIDNLLTRPLFYGLSGGERKRLELYLSLLSRPKLLLLDEPDSGVDIDSLARIAQTINMLIREKVTLLIVTHRGDILERLDRVDRVHVMCNGKVRSEGTSELGFKVLREGFGKVC